MTSLPQLKATADAFCASYSVKVCNSIVDHKVVVDPELRSVVRSNSEQVQATRLGLVVRLVRSPERVGKVEPRPVVYCTRDQMASLGIGRPQSFGRQAFFF